VSDAAPFTINPLLSEKLAYSPGDCAPVALLAQAPLFLAVRGSLQIDTMAQLVGYARAHPGKLNYGSSGMGSVHHLSAAAMMSGVAFDMTHVPFKGVGEAIPALLGGHIDLLFATYAALSGAADEKQIKLLATNGAARTRFAPDIPTLGELIPGFDFAPTIGILARAGTPAEVIDKIAVESVAVAKEIDVMRKFEGIGIVSIGAGPEPFKAALGAKNVRVTKAIANLSTKVP
jgi:tripartite-type tricarboxylate transporter receptor subunit TctC